MTLDDRGREWERLRRWRELSERAVRVDHWDEVEWDRIFKSMEPLRDATGELNGMLPTGTELMSDVYALLYKAAPELRSRMEMRPYSWLNHSVASEAPSLGDFTTVRRFTRGDPIAAALVCADLEPTIETLVDRQRQHQANAKKLQDMIDAWQQQQMDQLDLDEMIDRWENPTDEMLARQAEAQRLLDEAADQIDRMVKECENQADSDAIDARGAWGIGLQQAADNAKADSIIGSLLWGTEPGQLRRLPGEQRLELARKIRGDRRLRSIAEKFGAIKMRASSDRMRHNPLMPDEIVGVTLGRDLARVIPSEFTKLRDPVRRHEFYRDYSEGKLLQFDYTGVESSTKGGIILAEDGSGTMEGERERWAKAFLGNWMDIARQERREFHLIHFGSATEIEMMDFSTPDKYTPERVLEALELFFGGGTDFMVPLTLAVKLLDKEFAATGHVSGDVILLTDGICGVTDKWMSWYHSEQDRLGFTTWGVIIGMPRESQPVYDICRGNVYTVSDLLSGGSNLTPLYQNI